MDFMFLIFCSAHDLPLLLSTILHQQQRVNRHAPRKLTPSAARLAGRSPTSARSQNQRSHGTRSHISSAAVFLSARCGFPVVEKPMRFIDSGWFYPIPIDWFTYFVIQWRMVDWHLGLRMFGVLGEYDKYFHWRVLESWTTNPIHCHQQPFNLLTEGPPQKRHCIQIIECLQ